MMADRYYHEDACGEDSPRGWTTRSREGARPDYPRPHSLDQGAPGWNPRLGQDDFRGSPSSGAPAPFGSPFHGTTEGDPTDLRYPMAGGIAHRMSQLTTGGISLVPPPARPSHSIDRSNTYISGTPLDDTFVWRKNDKEFFVPGRVLACLWTEPAGETSYINPQDIKHLSPVFLGGLAYTNIQRFVIIQPRFEQHLSICCPIKTYGRRGTAKFQDPAAHFQHSIIYSEKSVPDRLPHELEYNKKPIQMIPEASIMLNERSRINFGKPTPVEHNLRMKRLGQVKREHLSRLLRYFDQVNHTDYSKSLSKVNVVQTETRHMSAAHIAAGGSVTDSVPGQELGSYEDRRPHEGEANEEGSRTKSQWDLTGRHTGLEYQIDVARSPRDRRHDGDDGDVQLPARRNTTGTSAYPTGSDMGSRRTSASYIRSRRSIADSIPEQAVSNYEAGGQVEGEGNEESQPRSRRQLSGGYAEQGRHVDVARSHHDRKRPDDGDTRSRDRTSSSPFPMALPSRPTVHNRSRTEDHSLNHGYYPHHQGQPRGPR